MVQLLLTFLGEDVQLNCIGENKLVFNLDIRLALGCLTLLLKLLITVVALASLLNLLGCLSELAHAEECGSQSEETDTQEHHNHKDSNETVAGHWSQFHSDTIVCQGQNMMLFLILKNDIVRAFQLVIRVDSCGDCHSRSWCVIRILNNSLTSNICAQNWSAED